MKKLMKIPLYIPFLGMFLSFVFFIIAAQSPNDALVIAGAVLIHLSAWILIVNFVLSGMGFFSMVLKND
ncbi:MAG: hypothetical protein JXR58_06260 [Bacteroidales bacterium]|nr:hypothetical protein [Bacteroidales bacterium]